MRDKKQYKPIIDKLTAEIAEILDGYENSLHAYLRTSYSVDETTKEQRELLLKQEKQLLILRETLNDYLKLCR